MCLGTTRFLAFLTERDKNLPRRRVEPRVKEEIGDKEPNCRYVHEHQHYIGNCGGVLLSLL